MVTINLTFKQYLKIQKSAQTFKVLFNDFTIRKFYRESMYLNVAQKEIKNQLKSAEIFQNKENKKQ